ncbi:pyruvate kinase, partial [Mycobacterium sp. ITM-2017-0098]
GELADLVRELDDLLACVAGGEDTWADAIAAVAPAYRDSARNMAHYWALRQTDLRDLQVRLADFGLSSLGRSEAHVEASLRLARAAALSLMQSGWRQPEPVGLSRSEGRELLRQNTIDLLGPEPDDRDTRIMVTLPSEAATDPGLAGDLLERGMNIARINCAHDDAQAWRVMAQNVRAAAAATGRTCLIAMDLGGPKLRTGPVQPGPRVVKLRPQRDALGRVITPAQGCLTPQDRQEPAAGPVQLPVPADWLARRRSGETLVVHDARGATRRLTVGDEIPGGTGRLVTAAKTTYVTTGMSMRVLGEHDEVDLGLLPETTQSLVLHAG